MLLASDLYYVHLSRFLLPSHVTLFPLLGFRVAETCIYLIASTGAVYLIHIYAYTNVNFLLHKSYLYYRFVKSYDQKSSDLLCEVCMRSPN